MPQNSLNCRPNWNRPLKSHKKKLPEDNGNEFLHHVYTGLGLFDAVSPIIKSSTVGFMDGKMICKFVASSLPALHFTALRWNKPEYLFLFWDWGDIMSSDKCEILLQEQKRKSSLTKIYFAHLWSSPCSDSWFLDQTNIVSICWPLVFHFGIS